MESWQRQRTQGEFWTGLLTDARGDQEGHVDRHKDLNGLGDKQAVREGRGKREQRPALLSVWGAEAPQVRYLGLGRNAPESQRSLSV